MPNIGYTKQKISGAEVQLLYKVVIHINQTSAPDLG